VSINQVWPTKKQPIAQPTYGPHEEGQMVWSVVTAQG